MLDDAGAAPVAAEPLSAPQNAGGDDVQPASGEGQTESAIDRSKETARHSIDRAFATLDGQETASDERDGSGQERARDEQGRFRAAADPAKPTPEGKPPVSAMDPPPRFSADAKAVWNEVPDSVKGEVSRAFRELEGGLSQYQQVFEPLKPYFQMAEEKGVTLQDSLDNYIALDRALVSAEPRERFTAIEHLLGYAGISPREYAAFVNGQPAEQTQSHNDQIIRELRQNITNLQNQLGGVTSSIERRREEEVLSEVAAFFEAHPRLASNELAPAVARLLDTGMATTLESAYEMAERLNPAPAPDTRTAASAAAEKPRPSAQTRKGQLSIAGAPIAGSNPVNRKPASTARESIDGAFAALGLG